MPSNRRTLLRRGLPCILGALTGCTTNDSAPETQSTAGESTQSSPSGRTQYTQTKSETTSVESTTKATTKEDGRRAVTFNHRKRVVDEGVQDASTRYYSRVFRSEDDAHRLDVANARNDFFEQDLTEVEQFVTDTDFETTNLLLVQAAVPSPNYELEFDFFSPAGNPAQTIAHPTKGELRGSLPAISTMLVRVPRRYGRTVAVTIVDRHGVYTNRPLHTTKTFVPPNELLFDSVDVNPLGDDVETKIDTATGAILTDSDVADQFTPERSPYADFTRETNFETTYILAVQAGMPTSGYFMLPQRATAEGSSVDVGIRQQSFAGGLNAHFTHLLLTRIESSSPPQSGTATIRRHSADGSVQGEQTVELTSTPDEWPDT